MNKEKLRKLWLDSLRAYLVQDEEYEKSHRVSPKTGLLVETEEERREHSQVNQHLLQIVFQNHENYKKAAGEIPAIPEDREGAPLIEDLPF